MAKRVTKKEEELIDKQETPIINSGDEIISEATEMDNNSVSADYELPTVDEENKEEFPTDTEEDVEKQIEALKPADEEQTQEPSIEDEAKSLKDDFKELEESKKEFNDKVDKEPEKAEEFIKEEIKKVENIKKRITERSQRRMNMLWNGQDYSEL